jgi:hypothetical protein
MPYQANFPLDNYWWDAQTNGPGPNLLLADGIVSALNKAPDYFIESGPGETTGISYAPEAQRPAILAAWRSSNVAMLAWMRANWGNAQLEIWFQGATTSWYGADIPPTEVNFHGAKLLRDLQTQMALTEPGFKMGSYVPDGHLYTTYRNEMAEGLGWVHYTVAGYHAVAEEMAYAMATNNNRASSPPAWTLANPPTNVSATKLASRDTRLSWSSPVAKFKLRLLSPVTSAVVRELIVTGTSYILTLAEQVELFGYENAYIDYRVAEYSNVVGDGPFAGYTGSVYLPNLLTPQNLKAYKETNLDVRFAWDAGSATEWYYRNLKADGSTVISEGIISGNEFIFTVSQQQSAYGFDVRYVRFEVSEYDSVKDAVGEPAVFNDDAELVVGPTVQDPTNGTATRNAQQDVTMSWDANDGTSWRVQIYNVGTGTVYRTQTVSSPSVLFTAQDQTALYGFTAGFFQWAVVAIKGSVESNSVTFVHDFNA